MTTQIWFSWQSVLWLLVLVALFLLPWHLAKAIKRWRLERKYTRIDGLYVDTSTCYKLDTSTLQKITLEAAAQAGVDLSLVYKCSTQLYWVGMNFRYGGTMEPIVETMVIPVDAYNALARDPSVGREVVVGAKVYPFRRQLSVRADALTAIPSP